MLYKKRSHSKGIYRSRRGVVLGVCRGLADYFDFSVFWARVIAVCIFFFSGLWPVLGVYLLAALVMKPEPVIPFTSDQDREFYDSYAHSRSRAAQRVKQRYESLERRLRRLEDAVTATSFDWDDRLKS